MDPAKVLRIPKHRQPLTPEGLVVEDLHNPGIEPKSLTSPALAGRFFTTSATWEAPEKGDLQANTPQSVLFKKEKCSRMPRKQRGPRVVRKNFRGGDAGSESWKINRNSQSWENHLTPQSLSFLSLKGCCKDQGRNYVKCLLWCLVHNWHSEIYIYMIYFEEQARIMGAD